MCHSSHSHRNVDFSGCDNLEIKHWTCDWRRLWFVPSYVWSCLLLILQPSHLESHVVCLVCHCVPLCGPPYKSCHTEIAFISWSLTWPQSPGKKNALCYIWLEASKSVLAIFYYLGPSNLPLAVVEKLPFLGSTASCALNLYQGEYSLIIFNCVKAWDLTPGHL